MFRSFQSMLFSSQGPNVTKRELSARTKRAQKFNNAYQRSTGMGMYTPHVSKTSDQHDKHWNS
jgi:hypothetical protein